MSGGKKKSGFQITSVTTDYGQASIEPQKASFPGDSSGPPVQPQQPPSGSAVANGGQSMAHSPSLGSKQPGHAHSSSLGRVVVVSEEGMGVPRAPSFEPVALSSGDIPAAGMARGSLGSVLNGPALLEPPIVHHNHTSCSQPGSPVSKRKQLSQEPGGSNFPHSSRFRVVRLGQGLGEPYRRGRWTCVDLLERDGAEERGLRRVMDSMRHAHSLESLETVGLSGFEGGGQGAILKPLGHIRALRTGHLVHSQGTTHLLAPHMSGDDSVRRKPFGEGACKADSQKRSPASKPQTFSSGPPSPTHKGHLNVDSTTFGTSIAYAPRAASPQAWQDSRLLSPTKHPSESVRPRHIPSPLRLDMDAAGKSLLRETRSQPTSPSSILPRDRGFHQSATPIQTPSALSLAQSMFGGAFDLGDGRSPKNGSQLPSSSSPSPGSILTDPSPCPSPPLSRSSSAPSSPTLRRTACFSISPSTTNFPPVILHSSHPNLHLASQKMPSRLHHAPPTPPSCPRHPVTPPALPRQLKLPRGGERRREEGLCSSRPGVSVRSSWPSSRTDLCSSAGQRCTEATERRSPCTSISCEKTAQFSCRGSPPNTNAPGGASVGHTQAAFGKIARGASGDRENISTCFSRLKTPALPSHTHLTGPTTMPRKQSQIHSPTLTRKHTLSVTSQPITGLGLPYVLKPQPYGTHSLDPSTERDLITFAPVKMGGFYPPFLDSAQTQSRSLAVATAEINKPACFDSNTHQSRDHSGCTSLRAPNCYCNSNPIDTCDRRTQTQTNAQKDCDVLTYQTGTVGHLLMSKEVQTVNVCAGVSTAQLLSRVAQNPVQISASSPGLNSSGASSTGDMGLNSKSWAGSASFRQGQNCSSGAFQAQDHNGNKVCFPSNVVNPGSLNSTVGSHGCAVSHDIKAGPSLATSELSSSITCSHPSAHPGASVPEASRAALQGPVHTIAAGTTVQGPVHTTATVAAIQGPATTTAVQGDIRWVPTPALPKTSEPSTDATPNRVRPSRVKPHMEGNEPKQPKPVPLTLTRNSDKAFLSLLLFMHSGSSNSMIAIDSKIEQAMDLVKTHLMMAVREEVELLREQIKELSERNAQLERENYILRALRERD